MTALQRIHTELTRASGSDREVVDREVVQRLSVLPEDRILDYFWLMVRSGAEPLPLLLQVGHVVVVRPADWDFAGIRREHEQRPAAFGPRIDRTKCFACEDGQRILYFHHILEVQHGGSNALRNKVPLCFSCHQYLHPWLKEEPTPLHGSVAGMESLWSIMSRQRVIR